MEHNSYLALPGVTNHRMLPNQVSYAINENSYLALPIAMPQLSERLLYQSYPYLTTPALLQFHPKFVLANIMDGFASPSPQESEWTKTTEMLYRFRRMVAIEFWRVEVDSTFTRLRLPRLMRKHVHAEVTLWRAILRLLERLNTLEPMPHPVLTFGDIIKERKLTLFNWSYTEHSVGAKELIRALQTENRQLQTLKNPFTLESAPITYLILDKAMGSAEEMDGFRKDFYMKVVKARMRLVNILKEDCARSFHNGRMQQRGRKKLQSESSSG